MSSAQDPFYIVKEEIQESIDKLQSIFHRWEDIPLNTGERVHLTMELLTNCESIDWQVDELDKTINVAAGAPKHYGIADVELEKRRRWTSNAHMQVGILKKAVEAGKEPNKTVTKNVNGMRQELMRLPNDHSYQPSGSNQYASQDNDDFVSSESDTQMLLLKHQDEELDELSASVQRMGHVGLTIHEELRGQEKIIHDFGLDMESTKNRLDFVQGNNGLNDVISLRSFTYGELEKATDGFKEAVGRGSFGTVFKGTLPHINRLIAVKRLEKVVEDSEREFQAEMRTMGRAHHGNLVQLLGYCHEGTNRLLVYEYTSNGSLADFLFRSEEGPGWNERVQIALYIARGILYLHEECIDIPIPPSPTSFLSSI